MRQVVLGKSGLRVSEVGFGGIPLTRVEPDEADRLIRFCVEAGVNFFDTANMYGDSEAKMGRALEPVRDKVVIATKTAGRDAKTAAAHIANSLKDLRTDRIDLLQLHNVSNAAAFEPIMAPGGALEAALEAQAKGQVLHLGFSSHNQDYAEKMIETGRFTTMQFPLNFIESDPLALFDKARLAGLGLIGMKPLGGGLLDRADLCFRWLMQYPDIVPIPGFQSRAEVEEVLALYADKKPLTDRDLKDIKAIKSEVGTRFCHRCEYCLPCEQGVLIPQTLIFKSLSKRFPREKLLDFTEATMALAENCIACQECVERCPYNLPIPEMIEEYLALYRRIKAG